ncbi:MAG: DUF4347 domain-containing protein [Gemmataceae bacterium]
MVESLEDRLVPATLPSLEQLMAQSGTLTILSPEVASLIPMEELAGSRVLTLDAGHDVVDQISDYFKTQGTASLGVVRVIGHGSDGTLYLGDQLINQQTLANRAGQVGGWKRVLQPGADQFLYCCSVASTTDGRQFVQNLSQITGADVAASTDTTGARGDLDLEYAVGDVQAAPAASLTAWRDSGVSLGATQTTLSATPSKVAVGGSFTLSAYVNGTSPTGTVTFYNGTTSLGTGTLNGAFITTLSVPNLPAGVYSITASYAGDANNDPSTSAAISVQVGNNPALFSSPPTTTFEAGKPQSFQFAVTQADPAPTWLLGAYNYFYSTLATLPSGWGLKGSAAITGGQCICNRSPLKQVKAQSCRF